MKECQRCPDGYSHSLVAQTDDSSCQPCGVGTYAAFNISYTPETSKRYVGFSTTTLESAYDLCSSSETCLGISQDGSAYTYGGLWYHGSYTSYRKVVSTIFKCLSCPSGRYQDKEGKSVCNKCVKGTYQDEEGRLECKTCGLGRFQGLIGKHDCDVCPTGRYGAETGLAECVACAPGTYQDQVGSTACLACPINHMQDQEGALECMQCPTGTYQPQTGQTNCDGCNPGTRTIETNGVITCEDCPVGMYNPLVSQYECTPCGLGRYGAETGLASCTMCNAYSYNMLEGQTSCIPCPNGQKASLTRTSCETCEPGTIFDGTICKPCEKGSFAREGAATCLKCGFGTYSDIEGIPECKKCAAGTYSLSYASTTVSDCKSCNVGTYSVAGSYECVECPIGRYGSETGLGVCVACPIGTYSDSIGRTIPCENCVAGFYSDTIASIECKRCEKGRYQDAVAASSCVQCLAGTFNRRQGTSTPLGAFSDYQAMVHDGYWSCPNVTIDLQEKQTLVYDVFLGKTLEECALQTTRGVKPTYTRFRQDMLKEGVELRSTEDTNTLKLQKSSFYYIIELMSKANVWEDVVNKGGYWDVGTVVYIFEGAYNHNDFPVYEIYNAMRHVFYDWVVTTSGSPYAHGGLSEMNVSECETYAKATGRVWGRPRTDWGNFPIGCVIYEYSGYESDWGVYYLTVENRSVFDCGIAYTSCVMKQHTMENAMQLYGMEAFVYDKDACWVMRNVSSPYDISSFYYYRDMYTSPCGDEGTWVSHESKRTYVYDKTCMDCPVGLYQDETGQGSCKGCDGGYYQNRTKQTECRKCPVGEFEKFDECVSTEGMVSYVFDREGAPFSNINDLVKYKDTHLFRPEYVVDDVLSSIRKREGIKDFETCAEYAFTDVFMFQNGECYF